MAQQRVLKIGEISFHVDRKDLAAAIAGDLLAEREAGKDQAAMLGLITRANDIFLRTEAEESVRKRQNGRRIPRIERAPLAELAHHRRQLMLVTVGRHEGSPHRAGARTGLSATRTP